MKRDPNSNTASGGNDKTLPRSKILRGRHNFRRLFEQSSVIQSPGILFRYRYYDDPGEGFSVGFIANRKLGKAATRNRIKRLLREAYRTHQHLLSGLFAGQTFGMHGVFAARKADLTYKTAETEMIGLLKRVHNILTDHTGSVKPRPKEDI